MTASLLRRGLAPPRWALDGLPSTGGDGSVRWWHRFDAVGVSAASASPRTDAAPRPTLLASAAPSLCVVLPPGLCAAIPAALLPGSLAESSGRWVMESVVGVGSVTMGLPGLMSFLIFLNPMLEAMPRIRHDRDVGRLPLLPYSAMATQGMVWTLYGMLVCNPAIWTPNFGAMLLGMWYCREYSRYCPKGADWLPYTQRHHAAGFAATALWCLAVTLLLPSASAVTTLGLTGNVMTAVMFGGPLAAIGTVVRERCTRSLPLGFTMAVNVNCNLWFFYAYFMLDDPFIYVQDGVGLILTTVQMALFARYGVYVLPAPRWLWGLAFKETSKAS